MSRMTYMDGMVYMEAEKDVNKVVNEANVVDKKLNEGSQLEDMVMMNVFIRFLLVTAYKLKDIAYTVTNI